MLTKKCIHIITLLALTACGGGGSGTDEQSPSDGSGSISRMPTLSEALSKQNIRVLDVVVNGAVLNAQSSETTLGAINRNGGSEQIYSGRVNGKIYGIATPFGELPVTATLTSSNAIAGIQDGSALYDLQNGTVVVSLYPSSVSTTLSAFSGTRHTSNGVITNLNKGDLDLSVQWVAANLGGSCGQNQFYGGTIGLSGNDATNTTPSGNAHIDAHGAFYGPNGSEVGGVITVEDTGRLSIIASFLGQ